MSDGSLDPLYAQLLMGNWIRVALVTAFGLLQVWLAARGFWGYPAAARPQ